MGYCKCLCLSVCPLCYLLLNHWTKSNQIWCVSCSHERGVQQHNMFWPHPLGRGQKVKYHQTSISKIFISNFVFVLKNKRYKTYRMGFSFYHLGHAPGASDYGALGVPRGVKNYLAYQIDGDDKQNRMQVKFSPWSQTGDLGVRFKGQILNFSYKVNFKDFYTKLCVCSHK